ncbi:MAG: class I SAM-dependent methyltransferase [Methanotrichaceae archaeon]|nr:class I SAM-dependent methyltransferase [Methanotrichaceae archaeon]
MKSIDESTIACYERHSNAYDLYQVAVVPHYQEMLDIVSLACLRYLMPNSKIIDLGCGTGNASLTIVRRIPVKIFLIDGSSSMMGIAYEKIRSTSPEALIGSKVANLSRENWVEGLDCGYDAIISTLVLEHLPLEDYKVVLQKCFEILKPGGWLMAVEGYDEEGSDIMQWFNEEMEARRISLDPEISGFVGKLRNDNGVHYYTSKRQKETLWRDIGFDRVNVIWQYLSVALMIGRKSEVG